MIYNETLTHYNFYSEEQPRFYLTYNNWSVWTIHFHSSKNVNLRKIKRFKFNYSNYYVNGINTIIEWGRSGWAVHRCELPHNTSLDRILCICYMIQAQIKIKLEEVM